MDSATVIGFLGVGAILAAYFLSLMGTIETNGLTYLIINLIGATLAAVSSILIKSLPFTILEITWALVSLVAIVNLLRKKT
jgi:hypothetical protein